MFSFTVHWFDQDSGVDISKAITMDAIMLEDIALEQIPKGSIRDLLNELVPWVEIDSP